MLAAPPPPFDWHGLTIHDLTAGLESRSSLARITVSPGAAHPLAWSRTSEKLYLILEGQLHFFCMGQTRLLNPGDLLVVPQGERFAYINQTNRPVTLLLMHTPRYDDTAEVVEGEHFPRPLICHIARQAEWEAAAEGDYIPAGFAQDGFIHLCEPHQVAGVRARYYAGQADLLLLKVDPLRLAPLLRWEDSTGRGERFPHLYGALNRSAVLAVELLEG